VQFILQKKNENRFLTDYLNNDRWADDRIIAYLKSLLQPACLTHKYGNFWSEFLGHTDDWGLRGEAPLVINK